MSQTTEPAQRGSKSPSPVDGSTAARVARPKPHGAAFRELLEARDRDLPRERTKNLSRATQVRDPDVERGADRGPGSGWAPITEPLPAQRPAQETTIAQRAAEANALVERAVVAMQLGRVGRTDHVARMRLAVGRDQVDVELVHDGSRVRATLRADDPRLASAVAARIQREFDAAGIGFADVEVDG